MDSIQKGYLTMTYTDRFLMPLALLLITLLPLSSKAQVGNLDNFEHIAVEEDFATQGRLAQQQPYFTIAVNTFEDIVEDDENCSLREAILLANTSYADNFLGNFRFENWQESLQQASLFQLLLGECPVYLIRPGFSRPQLLDLARSRMPRGQWALYTENIQTWIFLEEGEYHIEIEGANEDEGWTGDLDIHTYSGEDFRKFNEDRQNLIWPSNKNFCNFVGENIIDENNVAFAQFAPQFQCSGGIGIIGAGLTKTSINGHGLDRIFHIHKKEFNDGYRKNNFYIAGVHLKEGRVSGKGYESGNSPYASYGGAILAENSILVEKSSFSNNRAVKGGAVALIGADEFVLGEPAHISDDSYFKNLILLGNSAESQGGAFYLKSVDLSFFNHDSNSNTTNKEHLDKLQFIMNTAPETGGAVYSDISNLHFSRSSFSMNSSQRGGGAIYNHGYLKAFQINPNRIDWRPSGGSLSLENSSFVGNISGVSGAAIQDRSFRASSINHSTFYLNFASESGAAIDNDVIYEQVVEGLENTFYPAKALLKSTIVSQNYVFKEGQMTIDDCTGKIISHGQNLVYVAHQDLTCDFEDHETDQFETNPLLTFHLGLPILPRLTQNSPAIDRADDLNIAGDLIKTDLLGRDRNFNLGRGFGLYFSDIGAHELSQGEPKEVYRLPLPNSNFQEIFNLARSLPHSNVDLSKKIFKSSISKMKLNLSFKEAQLEKEMDDISKAMIDFIIN